VNVGWKMAILLTCSGGTNGEKLLNQVDAKPEEESAGRRIDWN